MTMTPGPTWQADRARQTIWRLFERRHLSADVATARLLMVDLAVHGRVGRLRRRAAETARAAPAPSD
jgi:hypothetical protein